LSFKTKGVFVSFVEALKSRSSDSDILALSQPFELFDENGTVPKLATVVDKTNLTAKLVDLEKLDNFALKVEIVKFTTIFFLGAS
jgi:hypothetical protein